MFQAPFTDVQEAEAGVGNNQCGPSTLQPGEAERLLPVTLALGEGPELVQGPRQPRLGTDPHVCTGRAGLPLCRLYAPS